MGHPANLLESRYCLPPVKTPKKRPLLPPLQRLRREARKDVEGEDGAGQGLEEALAVEEGSQGSVEVSADSHLWPQSSSASYGFRQRLLRSWPAG